MEMKTGLFDKNNKEVRIGDTLPDIIDKYADVDITGKSFAGTITMSFACMDEPGISDVSKMEIINREQED